MRPKSKAPRKQRKYNYTAIKHEVHKLMSANLSPELRSTKGFRSLPVKVGDSVTIMRGKYKGRSGKVNKVMPQKQRVYVDKIMRGKTDKTEIPIPLHPSNLMITKYVTKDRRRMELINRRIKEESEKIDIESVLEELEKEEEEAIEIEDDELLESTETDDEEFEIDEKAEESEKDDEDEVEAEE